MLSLNEITSEFLLFSSREAYISKYCYPIITKEIFARLFDFMYGLKVMDFGAGSGYLSACLQKEGIDITPYDNYSTEHYQNAVAWTDVVKECGLAHIKDYDMVLLSWPYMDDTCVKVLDSMVANQCLIYQGELFGGCCGTNVFFDKLGQEFHLLESATDSLNDVHIQFFGLHDVWRVFVKK